MENKIYTFTVTCSMYSPTLSQKCAEHEMFGWVLEKQVDKGKTIDLHFIRNENITRYKEICKLEEEYEKLKLNKIGLISKSSNIELKTRCGFSKVLILFMSLFFVIMVISFTTLGLLTSSYVTADNIFYCCVVIGLIFLMYRLKMILCDTKNHLQIKINKKLDEVDNEIKNVVTKVKNINSTI